MKFAFVLILIALTWLVSCGDASNKKTKEKSEATHAEQHQHDTKTQSIELNQGQKWKIDANMMVHLSVMEKDVKDFSMLDVKDYKALSVSLQKNINRLTSNCTMKGKAHDELHKWLLPTIDLVEEFSKSKNEKEAQKHFESIQVTFYNFHKYFQ